jgi:hypothetical protein
LGIFPSRPEATTRHRSGPLFGKQSSGETLQATNSLLLGEVTMAWSLNAAIEEKPAPKRKKPDYAQLVHYRTGRLTRAYWLLVEGFTQDVRSDFNQQSKGWDWRTQRHIDALVKNGWLQNAKGPRGGSAYRTTSNGAFMMLVAKGIHEAKKHPPEEKA